MIFKILGIACVVIGLICNILGKKAIKSNKNLRIGQIKDINKTTDHYKVTVSYIPNQDGTVIDDIIFLKHKPQKKHLCLEMTSSGIEIYHGKFIVTICSMIFWILGLLFLLSS